MYGWQRRLCSLGLFVLSEAPGAKGWESSCIAGAAEEEDLKAGGRFSGHATPLQPRSRMSVGIIFLREIELLVVPNDDTSSSGPSTA